MMVATYDVRLTPRARREFDEIVDYVVARSPKGGLRVLMPVSAAINSLAILPTRNKRFRDSRVAARVIYACSCPPYVIYYRVEQRAAIMWVVSVRHGARLPPTRFLSK